MTKAFLAWLFGLAGSSTLAKVLIVPNFHFPIIEVTAVLWTRPKTFRNSFVLSSQLFHRGLHNSSSLLVVCPETESSCFPNICLCFTHLSVQFLRRLYHYSGQQWLAAARRLLLGASYSCPIKGLTQHHNQPIRQRGTSGQLKTPANQQEKSWA